MGVITLQHYIREKCREAVVKQMEHAGYKAVLNRALRLPETGQPHRLPSGVPVSVFPIATLPGCPDGWLRDAGSYVCPVSPDWGLWFSWTMNDELNTAVLPVVKGMNPITGGMMEGLGLEQYADKCPRHDKPFGHGRYCEECGFTWPSQNYVAHPNTLWWDGFRSSDGLVRQFFFTEDEERDIASKVIGKQNTVPAFGFAFFKPVNPRIPPQNQSHILSGLWSATSSSASGSSISSVGAAYCLGDRQVYSSGLVSGDSGIRSYSDRSGGRQTTLCVQSQPARRSVVTKKRRKPKKSKSVSVGAGAEIMQNLVADTLGVDGWNPDPCAVIRLYFCFEQQFREIVDRGGVHQLEVKADGYMNGLEVG